MSRWIGFVADPVSGGSTLDALKESAVKILAPTKFYPAQTAQVEPGLNLSDRSDEVRGRRGNTAPVSFTSLPALSLGFRAYPDLVAQIVTRALGGSITESGGPTGEKIVFSTVEPKQSGNLPGLIAWLLREGQVDRLTGLWVSDFTFNLPIETEGSLTVNMPALYHDVKDASTLEGSPTSKDPSGATSVALPTASYTGLEGLTFSLITAIVKKGSGEVEIPDLAGATLSFSNNLLPDPRSRYRPNHNIEQKTVGGASRRLWYPARHKLGAQAITGTLELSDVTAENEVNRLFANAEKLILEVEAGPAGASKEEAVNETLKITIGQAAITGGGAEPLVREGDQVSTYNFGGYIDAATSKDIVAVFGKKAIVP